MDSAHIAPDSRLAYGRKENPHDLFNRRASATGNWIPIGDRWVYGVARKWRRGEGVEPSGNNISRQAGFEDRWGHRAPSSSAPLFIKHLQRSSCKWSRLTAHILPTIFDFG